MNEDIFKALSNITRVRILACLSNSDKSVTDLISMYTLSQSAVSQHLMYLKSAGLLYAEKKGRQQIYKLAHVKIGEICKDLLTEYERIVNSK